LFTLQLRRKGTTACQLLVPVILLFIALIINWISLTLIPTINSTQIIPPTVGLQVPASIRFEL
jgi:hypothetical protein